ncbi:MAG: KTSC domain-containing protein [Pseudobacter sp.]|uniref:KTSC domain-containing protein n=1 Tax=Pseudobacter sp. TaxID=2045420 RepID=UPI003F7E0353
MPSTVIRSFVYDADQETLIIEFVSGNRYRYQHVDKEVVEAFRAYREKGVFYNRHIKGKYAFIRMEEPE